MCIPKKVEGIGICAGVSLCERPSAMPHTAINTRKKALCIGTPDALLTGQLLIPEKPPDKAFQKSGSWREARLPSASLQSRYKFGQHQVPAELLSRTHSPSLAGPQP